MYMQSWGGYSGRFCTSLLKNIGLVVEKDAFKNTTCVGYPRDMFYERNSLRMSFYSLPGAHVAADNLKVSYVDGLKLHTFQKECFRIWIPCYKTGVPRSRWTQSGGRGLEVFCGF